MIVLDANAIVLLIAPGGAMLHIENGPRRVRRFVEDVSNRGETILLPSPALAEVIAGGSDRLALVREEVSRSMFVRFAPFDAPAAIEAGARIRERVANVPASARVPNWKHAMMYDALIAAIASTRNARAVLTDDRGIEVFLHGSGVDVIELTSLPDDPQPELPL